MRVRWAGRRPRLWRSVIKELEIAEELTGDNDVLTLTMCVNYGGRAEIADAAAAIAREVAAGRLNPDKVDEKTVARYLDEPDMPDVDLFLRSSGEQRTSNFLLWQSAYAELVFLDTLWPDFDRRHLWRACEVYASRQRRFGVADVGEAVLAGDPVGPCLHGPATSTVRPQCRQTRWCCWVLNRGEEGPRHGTIVRADENHCRTLPVARGGLPVFAVTRFVYLRKTY